MRIFVDILMSFPQLAPELPPQETFVFNWKAVTNYFIEATGIWLITTTTLFSHRQFQLDIASLVMHKKLNPLI